jgi:hypothetical protein
VGRAISGFAIACSLSLSEAETETDSGRMLYFYKPFSMDSTGVMDFYLSLCLKFMTLSGMPLVVALTRFMPSLEDLIECRRD